MRKPLLILSKRWLSARRVIATRLAIIGLSAYLAGGCISSPQVFDFLRTEVARLASDVIGQTLLIVIQAVNPGLAGS